MELPLLKVERWKLKVGSCLPGQGLPGQGLPGQGVFTLSF